MWRASAAPAEPGGESQAGGGCDHPRGQRCDRGLGGCLRFLGLPSEEGLDAFGGLGAVGTSVEKRFV